MKPTLNTAVLLVKGVCMTYIPFGSAISVGLPPTNTTVVFGIPLSTFISATVAAAGGLLAFLSSSFGKYQADKEREGTEFLPKPKP